MPLIKNKFGAKGSKDRSKYVTRKIDRAIKNPDVVSKNETTAQKLSKQAKETRILNNDPSKKIIPLSVSGVKLGTVNQVVNVFTLNPGESLKDLIISHYHTSGASTVVSLHWSNNPITDLTFTTTVGIITATTGGTTYRLMTESFIDSSTLALANSGIFEGFEKVSKTQYFYMVCSVLGPEITVIKN